jgi:hypothetical protein
MKNLLLIVLAIMAQTANAATVKIEILFHQNFGLVATKQIYISKIDGVSTKGNCEIVEDNKRKCTFERFEVDTYNGLNVLFAFDKLSDDLSFLEEHGIISTTIDGELYNQRPFKLDLSHDRGSIADVAGIGFLNINY